MKIEKLSLIKRLLVVNCFISILTIYGILFFVYDNNSLIYYYGENNFEYNTEMEELIEKTHRNSQVTIKILDNILEEIKKIKRIKYFDRNISRITRTTGLYWDNEMTCIWLEDKEVDDLYETIWHELSHHNITLSKLKKPTQDFIDNDSIHFCNY